jgi:hypothetical protein
MELPRYKFVKVREGLRTYKVNVNDIAAFPSLDRISPIQFTVLTPPVPIGKGFPYGAIFVLHNLLISASESGEISESLEGYESLTPDGYGGIHPAGCIDFL